MRLDVRKVSQKRGHEAIRYLPVPQHVNVRRYGLVTDHYGLLGWPFGISVFSLYLPNLDLRR